MKEFKYVQSISPPVVYEFISTIEPCLIEPYFTFINKVFSKGLRFQIEGGEKYISDAVSDILESVVYEDYALEYDDFQKQMLLNKERIKNIVRSFRRGEFFTLFDDTSLYSDKSDKEFYHEFKSAFAYYQMLWAISNDNICVRGFVLDMFLNMVREDLIRSLCVISDATVTGVILDFNLFFSVNNIGIVMVLEY